jgi:hypothetical protein
MQFMISRNFISRRIQCHLRIHLKGQSHEIFIFFLCSSELGTSDTSIDISILIGYRKKYRNIGLEKYRNIEYRIANFHFRYSDTVSKRGKSIGPKKYWEQRTKIPFFYFFYVSRSCTLYSILFILQLIFDYRKTEVFGQRSTVSVSESLDIWNPSLP